jgi:hypothetical protein
MLATTAAVAPNTTDPMRNLPDGLSFSSASASLATPPKSTPTLCMTGHRVEGLSGLNLVGGQMLLYANLTETNPPSSVSI